MVNFHFCRVCKTNKDIWTFLFIMFTWIRKKSLNLGNRLNNN